MHVVIVDTPFSDWHNLYLNGKWVSHGHHIEDQYIIDVLIHLGYDVQFNFEIMSEECATKYEGAQLPQNIKDLDFQ